MKGSSPKAALWVVSIVLSIQVISAIASCKVKQQRKPAAIFVLGDGLMDVGNNNYLNSTEEDGEPPRANHSYYGIDFPGSEATGRFSNGYNIVDFIAKAMRLNISPPPYLSMTGAINMDCFTGVNYASEGARIWENYATDDYEISISLSKQVENFAATRAEMEAKLGRCELTKLLSSSLFLVGLGTKDVFNLWWLQNARNMNNKTNIQRVMSIYGARFKALYDEGARKFGVINVPLIGCAPAGQMPRDHRQYVRGRCDQSKKILAAEFNDGLGRLLANLSSELRGFRYSVGDFYAFSDANLANPSAAGFVNNNTECCSYPCRPDIGDGPCKNRGQYWFWDESYPTEKAAKLAATAFYNGPEQFTKPVNFKKLVHTN